MRENGSLTAMIYHTTYRPRAASQIPQGSPLSQFVEFLWFREGDHLPQSQSLDELWQGRAAELRDRLIEAPTAESRFLILEQFLLRVMQSPDRATVLQEHRHPVVDFALREFRRSPTPSVSKVIDQVGCSARHFNQLFRDQVGLTPKLFCRVRRLRQVLYRIAGKSQVDWADIAFTCGYFDQAHLIHDFRSFADCTPTEYLAQRGFHPCHVVLPN
jgi:AraC-like DNA-binding protein